MNYALRITNKTHRLLTAVLLVFFILLPFSAGAVTLESGIPGVDNPSTETVEGAPGTSVAGPAEYIKFIYLFVLGFVGIAGFVSLVVWGTVWTASGIIDKKRAAIDHIKSTLIGIGLALVAFILLNTINPDLTVIREPSTPKVDVSSLTRNVSGVWLCPSDSTTGYQQVSVYYCKDTPKTCDQDARPSCWKPSDTESWRTRFIDGVVPSGGCNSNSACQLVNNNDSGYLCRRVNDGGTIRDACLKPR